MGKIRKIFISQDFGYKSAFCYQDSNENHNIMGFSVKFALHFQKPWSFARK